MCLVILLNQLLYLLRRRYDVAEPRHPHDPLLSGWSAQQIVPFVGLDVKREAVGLAHFFLEVHLVQLAGLTTGQNSAERDLGAVVEVAHVLNMGRDIDVRSLKIDQEVPEVVKLLFEERLFFGPLLEVALHDVVIEVREFEVGPVPLPQQVEVGLDV